MAAGLGFKTFATGDVLTAADTNGYLMSQTVMVFADSTARGTAITSPQQGMLSFLKGTNSTEYYSGTAWVPISSVSPLTTKGDLYGFSTTNARVAVGTNGQYLAADSTAATGVAWVTPAAGGFVGAQARKSSQTISNTTFTILTFNTETFDTNGFHDNVTNNSRMTVPSGKAGKYLVNANFQTNNGNSGANPYCYLHALVNGAVDEYYASVSSWNVNDAGASMTTLINLAVGDYVEIRAYQKTGGSVTAYYISFDFIYLGA